MMEDIFSAGGWLSGHLSNYRVRSGQIEMAKEVTECLSTGDHLLAEAPTGVGKSMAYGMPAAIHSLETKKTVMIATANITLQEQLFSKDMPLIADVLDGKFEDTYGDVIPRITCCLVKGMGNYVCLDKLAELEGSSNPPLWLDEILAWIDVTERGDKNELELEMDRDKWSDIAASSDDCTKAECKFFEECYVQQARQMAEPPNVVITNYHMLYTDLLVREATNGQTALLPDYDALIMDEAHEAVDIAMSFYGYELTESKIKWLSKSLLKMNSSMGDTHYRAILRGASAFFKKVQEHWSDDIIRKPLGYDGGLVKALRDAAKFIRSETSDEASANEISDQAFRVRARLKALTRTFETRAGQIEVISFGDPEEEEGPHALPYGSVFYREKTRQGTVKLCCKVIEVQGFLRQHLFAPKTVIATSATLSAGGSFDFVAREMGLNPGDYREKTIESPFQAESLLLVVPEGIPSPKQQKEHMDAVAKSLQKVVKDIDGRTMALFTSYRALEYINQHLRGKLKGIQILMQGEYTKPTIIRKFKENSRSVILATASFWQGVDIPGQDLSCIFIDKFPFMPPTDPVLRYIEAEMESEGSSAFFEYSLPKAVLSLKQGAGRLLRTEEDYGVIVLCDHRIDTTGYGKQFLKAFPPNHFKSEHGNLNDVKGFLDYMKKEREKRD